VLDLIASYPDLYFFYLAGNHDRSNSLRTLADKPENLCLFEDGWRSYAFGEVTVTGSERPDPSTLDLDPNALNILLMHGQEGTGRGEDIIRFSRLKNKSIDYLALGHLHEYRTAQIDARCTACYSGCLEGRGFDECGQKGYVLLEVEGGKISHRFVPLARRSLHTVTCDITGYTSQLDLENRLLDATRGIPAADLVKAVLVGKVAGDAQKDLVHLGGLLSERFYFAKLRDESRLLINPDDYKHDVSLKGEFVRRVMASSLSEVEKERVIACGFRALMGEEVGV
jgi:DNA repair exonuclease SbcCD nuclease subunit